MKESGEEEKVTSDIYKKECHKNLQSSGFKTATDSTTSPLSQRYKANLVIFIVVPTVTLI